MKKQRKRNNKLNNDHLTPDKYLKKRSKMAKYKGSFSDLFGIKKLLTTN